MSGGREILTHTDRMKWVAMAVRVSDWMRSAMVASYSARGGAVLIVDSRDWGTYCGYMGA